MAHMAIYHVQGSLRYFPNRPADVAMNSVYIEPLTMGSAVTSLPEVAALAFKDFFDATPAGQTNAVGRYLSAYILRTNGFNVKVYNPLDPIPRVPLFEQTYSLGSNALVTNSLPFEVNLCSSFQASRASGQSQARRRGRIFVGPLCGSALDGGSASVAPRPALAFRNTLAAAAARLAGGSDPLIGSWRQYVRSTVNNNFVAVTSGWVDDEFDTMRKRQVDPDQRSTWTNPLV